MDHQAKLSTRALCVFIGRQQILGPIDLSLEDGRLTALIGPQSAGKTTLLRALNRLMDERSGARVTGSILLDGQSIDAIDHRTLTSRIGMIFPEPAIFPGTVLENLAYGLRLRGVRDKALWRLAAEHALREALLWNELKDQLNHPASELSAEQKQRLCVARTLTLNPEILLLDEPWSSIDVGSRSRLEELVRELRGRYTILATVSDMNLAGRISDDAAFLLGGKIIEHGPTEELFYRPKDQRTGAFITGRFEAQS